MKEAQSAYRSPSINPQQVPCPATGSRLPALGGHQLTTAFLHVSIPHVPQSAPSFNPSLKFYFSQKDFTTITAHMPTSLTFLDLQCFLCITYLALIIDLAFNTCALYFPDWIANAKGRIFPRNTAFVIADML